MGRVDCINDPFEEIYCVHIYIHKAMRMVRMMQKPTPKREVHKVARMQRHTKGHRH